MTHRQIANISSYTVNCVSLYGIIDNMICVTLSICLSLMDGNISELKNNLPLFYCDNLLKLYLAVLKLYLELELNLWLATYICLFYTIRNSESFAMPVHILTVSMYLLKNVGYLSHSQIFSLSQTRLSTFTLWTINLGLC